MQTAGILEQVLSNLITHAIKLIPPTAKTRIEHGKTRRDTGVSIQALG
jgi:hypothetical protein